MRTQPGYDAAYISDDLMSVWPSGRELDPIQSSVCDSVQMSVVHGSTLRWYSFLWIIVCIDRSLVLGGYS